MTDIGQMSAVTQVRLVPDWVSSHPVGLRQANCRAVKVVRVETCGRKINGTGNVELCAYAKGGEAIHPGSFKSVGHRTGPYTGVGHAHIRTLKTRTRGAHAE